MLARGSLGPWSKERFCSPYSTLRADRWKMLNLRTAFVSHPGSVPRSDVDDLPSQ